MLRETQAFQAILNEFSQIKVDSYEYFYLRAIALYKTDIQINNNNNNQADKDKDNSQDVITSTSDESSSDLSHNNSTATIKTKSSGSEKSLEEVLQVKAFESHAKYALAAYEQSTYGVMRYKSLLGLLASLKLVSDSTIEELFFRRHLPHEAPLLNVLTGIYMQNKDGRWRHKETISKSFKESALC